jgi:hypothetical protein
MLQTMKVALDFFEKLIDIALERALTTERARETMNENVRKGRYTVEYYVDLWLKRLGGDKDAVIEPLVTKYRDDMEIAWMIFDVEVEPIDSFSEESGPPDLDYESLVGKSIRTAEGLRLRITAEVWENTVYLQTAWRKFVRQTKSKRAGRLSSELLRKCIDEISDVLPADNVPALDALHSVASLGPKLVRDKLVRTLLIPSDRER